MRQVPLSEAKDRLSALIDDVEATHGIVTITRHGRPAAVLMAADDLESLHETMYWLTRPDMRESLAEAERAVSAGDTISSADLRRDLGLSDG